ncbi:hypothetical protein GCM10023231_10400 [Olivibacter ginsenosidimutans]|uniref:Uncharacterized protein n=1 Tax=Olivibacter ginsenosidimutans TaxID=1176537 RepID=A0ABP9AT32_9SPHI
MSEFETKYHEVVLITKDTSITEVFASPVISNFVNKDGQFKVGDSLNILTEDRWILVSPDNNNRIDYAKSFERTDSIKGVFVRSYKNGGFKNPRCNSCSCFTEK